MFSLIFGFPVLFLRRLDRSPPENLPWGHIFGPDVVFANTGTSAPEVSEIPQLAQLYLGPPGKGPITNRNLAAISPYFFLFPPAAGVLMHGTYEVFLKIKNKRLKIHFLIVFDTFGIVFGFPVLFCAGWTDSQPKLCPWGNFWNRTFFFFANTGMAICLHSRACSCGSSIVEGCAGYAM